MRDADHVPQGLADSENDAQPPNGEQAPAGQQECRRQDERVPIFQTPQREAVNKAGAGQPNEKSRPMRPAQVYVPGAIADNRRECQDDSQ